MSIGLQGIEPINDQEIHWELVCEDEGGSQHYVELNFQKIGIGKVTVNCLYLPKDPEQSRWGLMGACQTLQELDLRTGVWTPRKEIVFGWEGQALHLDVDIVGVERPSSEGSVNSVRWQYVRRFLRDRKRRRIKVSRRSDDQRIGFFKQLRRISENG